MTEPAWQQARLIPDKWNQWSPRAGAPGNLGVASGHDCSQGVRTDTH
jgi:hypothetical protein